VGEDQELVPSPLRVATGVISAIVLAAGAGTRFGRTKQVVEVRGKPLAQHAVDAATDANVDEVVVVLGHDAERVSEALRLPRNARVVVNPDHETGMASSLAVGLRATDATSEAAVILLADQPGVRADHVRSLVRAFRDTADPVVRLRFRDGPGPALLARETWPEVTALTGDVGARSILDVDPERVRWISVDEDAPRDVDAPEDLDRA
jgi:molybdenum cofactor cytidylyltransferase